jgi:CRP/FNR family cyclic AMP-dependent transcriptional regulator
MNIIEMFRSWPDVESHPSHATIYSSGDPVDALYVILEGEAQLTLNGEPLSKEKAGGIVGEMALIREGEGARNLTVTALSDIKMARLDRQQLKERIEANSEFAIYIMSALASRLRAVDEFISARVAGAG